MRRILLSGFLCILMTGVACAQLQREYLNGSFTSTLWGTAMLPNGNKIVVGNSGTAYMTTGACRQWQQVSLPAGVTQGLRGASFANNDTGYICGTSGRMLKTTDGGTTWTALNTGVTVGLLTVNFRNTERGFAAGGGGSNNLIIKTTDGGQSWSNAASGLSHSPFDMTFSSALVGYVVGVGGMILKTVDGGDNWQVVVAGATGNPTLTSVSFVTDQKGFACGQSGTLRKTTDGGQNWTNIATGTTQYLQSISFANPKTGLLGGNNGTLMITADSGNTWTPVAIPFDGTIQDISFVNDSTAMVCGAGAFIGMLHLKQGYSSLLFEDFCSAAAAAPPYGWTNTAMVNEEFRFDNPNNSNGVGAVLTAPFAIFDSQHFSANGNTDNGQLESRSFDASFTPDLSLLWDEAYLPQAQGLVFVRVEAYNGSQWNTVYTNNAAMPNYTGAGIPGSIPRSISLQGLVGVADARIRFVYQGPGGSATWWGIDNVNVVDKKKEIKIDSIKTNVTGCNHTTADSVKLLLTNIGDITAAPIEVAYRVNGGTEILQLETGSIAPNSSRWVTFAVPANLSAPGTTVSAYLVRNYDSNPANDTITYHASGFQVALGADTTLCMGNALVLDAQVPNADSYIWSTAATTQQVTVTTPATYWVQVTKNGCTAADTIVVNYSSTMLQVALGADTTLCFGDTLVLDPQIQNADSYLWSTAAVTPQLQVNSAASYWVQVTKDGCMAADTIVVSYYPALATPVISQVGSTLFATGSGSYQWYLGGVAIPGANSASWVPVADGSYTVTISNANGCTATSQPYAYTQSGAGVADKTGWNNIVVYPNPSSAYIIIDGLSRKTEVRMYDMSMKMIGIYMLDPDNNKIATGAVNNGLYLLQMQDSSGSARMKLNILH